jgi:transcriptional regulator with XRE-family HTH domain
MARWTNNYRMNNITTRLTQQEQVLFDVTELLSRMMENMQVTPAELAKRLGKSPRFVSRLLDGQNLTLRVLSDVAYALGYTVTFKFVKIRKASR